jgi:hypothetical protein
VVGDAGAAPHWVRPLLPILHQAFQEMGTLEDSPRPRILSVWFTQGGYRFGNETKTFWYRSQVSLVENRLFQFCPESALLGKIEKKDLLQSFFCFISIRYRNVCGTFVECLFLYCFNITTHGVLFLSHSTVPISSKTYIFMKKVVLYF